MPHKRGIIYKYYGGKADAYLDPNFCPLITSALGSAIEGEYAGLAGIVLVNTCDGMRRLYDAWRFYSPPPFSFILDPPRLITKNQGDCRGLKGAFWSSHQHPPRAPDSGGPRGCTVRKGYGVETVLKSSTAASRCIVSVMRE